jgi:hypothetical protein
MRFLINTFTDRVKNSDGTYRRGKRLIPLGARLIETRGTRNSYTLNGQLDFSKIWNDHELSSIVGSEIRHIHRNSATTDRFGYNPKDLTFQKFNKELVSNTPRTNWAKMIFYDNFFEKLDRYFSLYGNFVYRYKERYVLSGSMRIDQSNLFATDPKNRYIPFWSVGAKWIISDEGFFDTNGCLNRLAFRTSYGVNGNVTNKYGYFDIGILSPSSVDIEDKDFIKPQSSIFGVSIRYPKISDLRWERTNTINFGLDIGILDDKIAMEIDFYNKETFDLLSYVNGDPTRGFSSYVANNANINNKGIEISLNTINLQKKDFKWTTYLTCRYNKNRVSKLHIDELSPSMEASSLVGYRNIENYPTNSFWLFNYVGLDGRGNPIIKDKKGKKYNLNEDAIRSTVTKAEDFLSYAGTIEPIYMISLSNSITYKKLSLSFMFVGYMGHVLMKDGFDGTYFTPERPHFDSEWLQINKEAARSWRSPGDEKYTNVPEAMDFTAMHKEIIKVSTKNVIPGDYIRLRELILTYSLSKKLLKKCHLKRVVFNAKANNLFLITANKEGIDPEAHGLYERYSRIQPSFTFGVQINF